MKRKAFLARHLTLAVVGAMTTAVAMANTEPTATLEREVINLDRQGTKIKTNVVNIQEKDESTATGLRELLKSEPAIDFGGGNGASQYITIRGMGQNSIDVKIDNAYSDSQILYHQGRHMLDPSLVKIVSVQKGAGSASAGIGATNGAIVAKTLDAKDLLKDGKDYGFKVGAGYSSNKEHSYSATAFGKAGAFDFLISGNKIDQSDYKAGKGYASPVDGGDKVRYQTLDKVSYLAKVGMDVDNHRFVLSHMNEKNKGVRNIREEFDWFERQVPNYRELSLTQTNLEWTGKNLGFVDEATANIYTLKNKRTSVGQEAYGNAGNGWHNGYNETWVDTKGANLNLDSYLDHNIFSKYHIDNVLLKYGLNYRNQEITPNTRLKATDLNNAKPPKPLGVDVVNQEKTDTGLYVEAIGDIGDVTATVGLRYDHFSFKAMDGKKVSDGAINPSVGLIWQALPNLSLNANHNHATRSPRMYDALTAHGHRGIVSIADGVKAEKAKNTEIGFNYKFTNQYGDFAVDGSYYWQKIDGLLNSGQVAKHDESSTIYYKGINNVGYAKNKGWELGASYKKQNLTARLGVADSKPEFYSTPDDKGEYPRFSNKEYASRLGRIWTAGLAYRFDNPSVEVGINHRMAEDAVGQSAYMRHITGDRGNDLNMHVKGYNATDIYANWKPYGTDKMNVNFAINNIGNEFYRTHTANSGLPAVGREFRVGVNFTY